MSINVNQCQSWHQQKTHLDCSLPSLTQVANCSSPSSHLVLLSCYWNGFCILICICCISCHGNRFCICFFRSRSLIVFELCVCNLYLPLWSHLHTKNPSILICKRMVRGWMSWIHPIKALFFAPCLCMPLQWDFVCNNFQERTWNDTNKGCRAGKSVGEVSLYPAKEKLQ